MAADSDGRECGGGVGVVVTCEGDLHDPCFPTHLRRLLRELRLLLAEPSPAALKVNKVEPWNSVRVTLSVPRAAAARLRALAAAGAPQLRALGILSVQLDGDAAVSLRLQHGAELRIATADDESAPATNGEALSQLGGLGRLLGEPAAGQSATPGEPVAGGSRDAHFKSPNTVCPMDGKLPANIPTAASDRVEFPFGSMTQARVIHRKENTLGLARPPPPYPAKPPPPAPNVAISSPLLVNLLQNEAGPAPRTKPQHPHHPHHPPAKLDSLDNAQVELAVGRPPLEYRAPRAVPPRLNSVPSPAPPPPRPRAPPAALARRSFPATSLTRPQRYQTPSQYAEFAAPPPPYRQVPPVVRARPPPALPGDLQALLPAPTSMDQKTQSNIQEFTQLQQQYNARQQEASRAAGAERATGADWGEPYRELSDLDTCDLDQLLPTLGADINLDTALNDISDLAFTNDAFAPPALPLPQPQPEPTMPPPPPTVKQSFVAQSTAPFKSPPSPMRPPRTATVGSQASAAEIEEQRKQYLIKSLMRDDPGDLLPPHAPVDTRHVTDTRNVAAANVTMSAAMRAHMTAATSSAALKTPVAMTAITTTTAAAISATTSVTAVVNAAPAASTAPAVNAALTVSVAPAASTAPAVSAAPAVNATPTVSTTPAVNATPTVSTTPAVSAAPIAAHVVNTGLTAEVKSETKSGCVKTDVKSEEESSRTDEEQSRVKLKIVRKPDDAKHKAVVECEKTDGAAEKEKIKLRLKLGVEPTAASVYKAECELRVPPLHISLRGRNSAVIKSSKKDKKKPLPVDHKKLKRKPDELNNHAESAATAQAKADAPVDPPHSYPTEKEGKYAQDEGYRERFDNHKGALAAPPTIVTSSVAMALPVVESLKETDVKTKREVPPAPNGLVQDKKRKLSACSETVGSTNMGTVRTASPPVATPVGGVRPPGALSPRRKDRPKDKSYCKLLAERNDKFPPRSPAGSQAQGEDSGIESMDALSEKSPNQASQSPPGPQRKERLDMPVSTSPTSVQRIIGVPYNHHTPCDIEAELAKMHADHSHCNGEVAPNTELIRTTPDKMAPGSPKPPASTDQIVKMTDGVDDRKPDGPGDLSPEPEVLSVRRAPPLYTYSNPEKPAPDDASDEDKPPPDANGSPTPLPLHKTEFPDKSLLEQLLIEIPTPESTSPSAPLRSAVRTRASSKLNSPAEPSPGHEKPSPRLNHAPLTPHPPAGKRKRRESESSCASAVSVEDAAPLSPGSRVKKKPRRVEALKGDGKSGRGKDSDSDSDEPLICKVRGKPVQVKRPAPPTTPGVVGTRRSVRHNTPAPPPTAPASPAPPAVNTQPNAARRKTRSAVGESGGAGAASVRRRRGSRDGK